MAYRRVADRGTADKVHSSPCPLVFLRLQLATPFPLHPTMPIDDGSACGKRGLTHSLGTCVDMMV